MTNRKTFKNSAELSAFIKWFEATYPNKSLTICPWRGKLSAEWKN